METYEEILSRMKESYAGYAGFYPPDESDIVIRLKVLAGEIYKREADAEYIKRQLFPSTATGDNLDMHAAERGLVRKPATKASGKVWFYPSEDTHPDILIPAGTEVCTYTDMKRFITDSDAVLASEDSRVLVDITASEAGSAYNARGGTVSIIVTPVTGIGRVYNSSVFTNGADAESDDELRKRVIDSYTDIVNGANAAYYKRLALSVPGVYSASAVGRVRGNGTVNVYISGLGEPVSTSVKNSVQQLMESERELNVDVQVFNADDIEIPLYIRLSVKPGYAFSEISNNVNEAVESFINALGIGADFRLSDAGKVISSVKGVLGFSFSEAYGSDVMINDDQYAVPGTIRITEV